MNRQRLVLVLSFISVLLGPNSGAEDDSTGPTYDTDRNDLSSDDQPDDHMPHLMHSYREQLERRIVDRPGQC